MHRRAACLQPAITVYTHVSDQFSAFSTRAISCSPCEAIYVLDGLPENDTLLRPREHYTDTHGFSAPARALVHAALEGLDGPALPDRSGKLPAPKIAAGCGLVSADAGGGEVRGQRGGEVRRPLRIVRRAP